MNNSTQWSNATGDASSWQKGGIIAGAATGVATVVSNIFTAKADRKTQQQIADSWNQSQLTLGEKQGIAQQQIEAGHDLAGITIAKIQADAQMNSKQSMSSDTAIMLAAGGVMAIAVIGIFFVGRK